MDIDLTPYIIAVFVRAILYGLYIASLVFCLLWLTLADHGWTPRRHIDRRLLAITLFIFMFLTTSLGVTFQVTIDLISGDQNSGILSIVKIAIDNTGSLITNAIVIYRCWIVCTTKTHYYQWAIVLVPLVLWLSALTSVFLIVYYYAMFLAETPGIPLVFARLVPPARYIWLVFYLCDITINVYAMCTMIYRIRKAAAQGSSIGSKQLHTTCRILAFFGSLYTITTLLSLISLIVDLQPQYDIMRFVLDSLNITMPGITFNLIQIAVHRERAVNASKRQAIIMPRYHSVHWQSIGSTRFSTLQDCNQLITS